MFPVESKINQQLLHYGVAIGFTLGALLLSVLLWEFVAGTPFIFFIGAVVLSAWRGGLGPGLLTGALAIVIVHYVLRGSSNFFVATPAEFIQLFIFALVVFLISGLEENRTRTQHALRDLKHELETILQGAADGVIAFDRNDNRVFANQAAARLLGYPSYEVLMKDAEAANRRRFDMLTESDTPLEMSRLPRHTVFRTGESATLTYKMRFNDTGEERWLALKSSPVLDKQGKVRLAVTMIRDITETQQLAAMRQEAETRLRTVLDNILAFVGVITPDGKLIEVNRAALEIAGLRAEDVIGQPVDQTYWWAHSEAVQLQLRDAMRRAKAGEIVRYDVTVRVGDDHFIIIDMMLAPSYNRHKQVEYLVASAIDITERINLTRQLTEQRRRLESILHSIPGIVYEGTGSIGSPDQQIDFVSTYAETLLGYPLAAWKTSPNFWQTIIHPADWERLNLSAQDASAKQTGGAVEFRCQAQDGRWLHLEAYNASVTDADGLDMGICGVILDATERKRQAEEVIRLTAFVEQQRQRLNQIVSNVPGIVYETSVSPQGGLQNVDFISSYVEKILGYVPEKWQADPAFWQTIIHPDDWEGMFKRTNEIYQNGASGVLQFRCFASDGRTVHLEAHSSALTDAQGKQLGACGVMMDITERKQNEEALLQYTNELSRSNAELEQFAYIASHDLQEPLRMVTSYLQLIEQRYLTLLNEDGREFIAFAIDGAARMKLLINDLLMFSRVQRSGTEFAPVDMNQTLEQVLYNLQFTIEDTTATITHDILPEINANEGQMIQLLQNLIGNALKFRSDLPPVIHIGVQRQERFWEFRVSDNGIGIAPDYQDRIFIIFQRLHARDAYPGTGIGLAICKKIVEKHGGQIRVDSQPGQGTTFYFTMPIDTTRKTERYAPR